MAWVCAISSPSRRTQNARARAAWRSMLDATQDAAIRKVLLACAALEGETADHLDALLANRSARLGDA